MSAITTLIENTIIDDLKLDSFLNQFTIIPHDEDAPKDPTTVVSNPHFCVIVVTAFDHGDFPGTFGAGIRKVDVEVEINMSISEPEYASKLDTIVDLIVQRMQPSTTIYGVTNRDWSTSSLKVFGVLDQNLRDARNDLDKDGTRQRIIERTFVAAQIA